MIRKLYHLIRNDIRVVTAPFRRKKKSGEYRYSFGFPKPFVSEPGINHEKLEPSNFANRIGGINRVSQPELFDPNGRWSYAIFDTDKRMLVDGNLVVNHKLSSPITIKFNTHSTIIYNSGRATYGKIYCNGEEIIRGDCYGGLFSMDSTNMEKGTEFTLKDASLNLNFASPTR